jgi:hypothetical protein
MDLRDCLMVLGTNGLGLRVRAWERRLDDAKPGFLCTALLVEVARTIDLLMVCAVCMVNFGCTFEVLE